MSIDDEKLAEETLQQMRVSYKKNSLKYIKCQLCKER